MGFNVQDVEGFGKNLIKIARKYPSSIDLVESFFEKLEGLDKIEDLDCIADHIKGLKLKGNRVYKSRLENPDAKKSARGGFRMIWYLVTSDKEIYPLTIYSKNDQVDITNKEIIRLITRYVGVIK